MFESCLVRSMFVSIPLQNVCIHISAIFVWNIIILDCLLDFKLTAVVFWMLVVGSPSYFPVLFVFLEPLLKQTRHVWSSINKNCYKLFAYRQFHFGTPDYCEVGFVVCFSHLHLTKSFGHKTCYCLWCNHSVNFLSYWLKWLTLLIQGCNIAPGLMSMSAVWW